MQSSYGCIMNVAQTRIDRTSLVALALFVAYLLVPLFA